MPAVKRSATRPRAAAGRAALSSARLVGKRATRTPSRQASGEIIVYVPGKGVVDYAVRVANATPMQLVEMERRGVGGRYIKDLARELGIAATRVFRMIDIPRATVERKAAAGERVTGRSGQAALALTRLVAIATAIVADSTNAASADFQAAKWLGAWIERPQPALGGRRPSDLLDTATGADIVVRLLGSMASGAYQ
jgi:putative toxin-antitoxin system antitoxin component (TIGR02293 family)